MSAPTTCHAALKEWAVAIRALDQGRQALIIRKGGIREDGNRFQVLHPEFLLFPSYEHQQAELLRPEHAQALAGAMEEAPTPGWLTFTHSAQVHRAFTVSELEELQALTPHHIWSEEYAEKRLRWRPRQPLTAMVLRVYRLETAARVRMLPRYAGCKSWLELEAPVVLGDMTPALSNAAFAERADAIDRAIATTAQAVAASR